MKTNETVINARLRDMIERKLGIKILYTSHCGALEQAIYDETGQHIGLTTLKRMFGFVKAPHVPRRSTYDILAQYLGYPDYAMLCRELGSDYEISEFGEVESIETERLRPGDKVKLRYNPKRELMLSYLGNSEYIVTASVGSKLREGDRVCISQFAKGFELLVTEVVRDGKSLGSYTGAKQGGLTYLEHSGEQ